MHIKNLKKVKSFKKLFVSPDGEIHQVDELHEKTAREICSENNWNWRETKLYSAEDYLMQKKGYVKFANYKPFHYVAVSKEFRRDKEVLNNAYYLADLFNLKIEMY